MENQEGIDLRDILRQDSVRHQKMPEISSFEWLDCSSINRDRKLVS